MAVTDSTFVERSQSNPFATRFICPGARTFLEPSDGDCVPASRPFFDSLARQLRSARRGLIVGPHGTGKSTLVQSLLPALVECYPSVIQTRLNRHPVSNLREWFGQHTDRLRSAFNLAHQSPRGGLVIIDGLEQIPAMGRAYFCVVLTSRCCDLLATSHHPMRGFASLYRTQLTPSLISQLATELTANCEEGCIAAIDTYLNQRDLSRITNARELWFDLYDVVASSRKHCRPASLSTEIPPAVGSSRIP